MKAGILDEGSFLKQTYRAILIGCDKVKWRDITLILSVADKLKLYETQFFETDDYIKFW